MSFVQPEFCLFLLVVLAAYWAVGRRAVQNPLLLVASAVFYGWVHPWFLALLYGSAVLDYGCGLAMARWPQRRRWFLALSLTGNLGLLGTFKYLDFFVQSFAAALGHLGLRTGWEPLGLFLPVGISFFTFQTMSYTLDVYAGRLAPRRDFVDYVVFVSFFPQLVAGPVERARNLLPQVERERRFDGAAFRSGLTLALWGAFKKVCVADQVAPFVDAVFGHPDPSGSMIWAASLGFSLQILADFSGYTDIARGVARMLGFEILRNFRHPYLATTPSDFWSRWHISFSTWIRDYLYIPLGGSRRSRWVTLRATFGALLLSGLWHGAAWTFVLWGLYHALLLVAYRAVAPRVPSRVRDARGARAAAVALMFGFTVAGWTIFRETRLDRLAHYATLAPWGGDADQGVAAVVMLGTTVVLALPLVAALVLERRALPALEHSRWRVPLQTLAWSVLSTCVFVMARDSQADFIYFRF